MEDEVVVEAPASVPAPAFAEPMDILTALQLVLRKSRAHGGLCRGRGLHEAAKVIEEHAARLNVKLVKALCADHNVSLITVPNAKHLASGLEIAGKKVRVCILSRSTENHIRQIQS